MAQPFWQSIASISLSALTALVAFAVYCVQSEKLFVDTFRLRLDALNECLDAARARIEESKEYRLIGSSQSELRALHRLWEAERAARPLFGGDFHRAFKRLEKVLAKFDTAYVELVDGFFDDADAKKAKYENQRCALTDAYGLISDLAETARPYIHLGTRGLSMYQRASIWFKAVWRRLRHRS